MGRRRHLAGAVDRLLPAAVFIQAAVRPVLGQAFPGVAGLGPFQPHPVAVAHAIPQQPQRDGRPGPLAPLPALGGAEAGGVIAVFKGRLGKHPAIRCGVYGCGRQRSLGHWVWRHGDRQGDGAWVIHHAVQRARQLPDGVGIGAGGVKEQALKDRGA